MLKILFKIFYEKKIQKFFFEKIQKILYEKNFEIIFNRTKFVAKRDQKTMTYSVCNDTGASWRLRRCGWDRLVQGWLGSGSNAKLRRLYESGKTLTIEQSDKINFYFYFLHILEFSKSTLIVKKKSFFFVKNFFLGRNFFPWRNFFLVKKKIFFSFFDVSSHLPPQKSKAFLWKTLRIETVDICYKNRISDKFIGPIFVYTVRCGHWGRHLPAICSASAPTTDDSPLTRCQR